MLSIASFNLGLAQTNAYLVADTQTGRAIVIDPAWDGEFIAAEAQRKNWEIDSIWLTHAHFDHIGGIKGIISACNPSPMVLLHPADLPLWRRSGGAAYFGLDFDPGPEPGEMLSHGLEIEVGSFSFQVRHVPGHTPGHVLFYCAPENVAFSGDVIFWGSVGRTDLPGGSHQTLIDSIQSQVLTLPDDTRLLTGHGPETTVKQERTSNPFLT